MNLYNEFVKGINAFRSRNKNIITNTYFTTDQLKSMFEYENLTVKITDEIILLLVEEEQLIRLYYYAVSLESLKQIKNIFPQKTRKSIITDIIGKEDQVDKIVNEFKKVEFVIHNKLIRMNRSGKLEFPNKDTFDVILANKTQANEIMDILYGEFDIYTSHLPTEKKLLESIENKEITVVILQGKIVGLAYFQKLGKWLNYLYQIVVDKSVRGKGVADSLLIHKFKNSSEDILFRLWVECNNRYAIEKYYNYNFSKDGLVDYILVYKGE